MTFRHIGGFFCGAVLLTGCTSVPQRTGPPLSFVADSGAREPITTSLFPSDQAVLGDEAVARILSSRLELPAKAKVALMRFPDNEGARHYGSYYWRDEQYLKLLQSYVEALTQALRASEQVSEVTPLPSLMTPTRVSIPVLREAAVRMQADLLLVFRVGSDVYTQYRAFAKDKVKAYSTCELVLLDIRTGLVPFTRVVSGERLELKQATDLDLSETMRRAKEISAGETLKAAAEDLVAFVKSAPRKGN